MFMRCPARFRSFVSMAALAFLGAVSPQVRSQVDLESGLQLYYTFDEGMGDGAGDLSGNLRGARIENAPPFANSQILWTFGRFGGAVDFDGTYFLTSPEYFGIGGKGARTISMWVNTFVPPSSTTVLAGWGPNVAQQRWHFKFEASTQGIRTENQGGNNFGSIPVADGLWHHVVCVFPEGGETIGAVDHYVDGVLDPVKSGGVTNPVNTVADPTGLPVTVGGSRFDAGYRYATTLIDEVRIYDRALTAEEIAALAQGQGVVDGAPPVIGAPAGVNGNVFVNAGGGLTFTINPVGTGSTITNVTMLVNGADVTGALNVQPGGVVTTVTYNGLEANMAYQVEVQAADSRGLKSARKLAFSTYAETNFIIEAEDYNFDGGQYINSPIACNVLGGLPECYFDKVSVPGVDAFDSRGFTDDTANFSDVYRYSRGLPDREEEFDTIRSTEAPRSRHTAAGVDDFEVNLLNAGDWANYTRDFPEAEAFRILLRARAGAAQVVRLELVTSGATTASQEVVLLGAFLVPASTSHGLVPLTDLSGAKALTVKLTGKQTIRLAAVEANANLNLNYLMFLPATDTAILPTVAVSAPAEGSVQAAGAAITVQAAADDEDGFVTQVSFSATVGGVEMALGTDTSAPYEVVWMNAPEGIHTVIARATDDDGLIGVSQPVTVIVDSTPPAITSVREAPGLDQIEIIFSEALDGASAGSAGNYQISPALAVASATASGQRVVLATAPQTRGTEYTVSARGVRDTHGVTQAESTKTFKAGDSSLLFGLELYLPFDEGAGAKAADLSGFGRAAGIFDAPAFAGLPIVWTNGQFSGAVNFDGTYFMGVPGYYGIGGAAPRTVSLWIKTDWVVPGGGNALMGWGRNVNTERWHFKLENTVNGALRTENQGGNNFGSIPVNDGQWHHVAVVFPEFGLAIGDANHYVDGMLDPVKSGGTANVVNTSTDPLLAAIVTVGGGPLGAELRRVTAVLDDVRLYNRALSDAEIQALAEGQGVLSGEPSAPPSLAVQKMGDGTITLTWSRGALQTTGAIGQPWSNVAGAVSPHAVTASGTAFFRLIIE